MKSLSIVVVHRSGFIRLTAPTRLSSSPISGEGDLLFPDTYQMG